MATSTPLPYFPIPPAQYTQTYMSEIVRSFSTFLAQYQNFVQQDENTAVAWFMG
jgi:hypothetical protein